VDLPHVLRDLLLRRVAQLDRMTQDMLRVAAAAGRDMPYPLLRTVANAPEGELRQALRRAVEHGVLVGDQHLERALESWDRSRGSRAGRARLT
jgi:predicted ATPase